MIVKAIVIGICYVLIRSFFIEFIKLVDRQKKYDRENRKD